MNRSEFVDKIKAALDGNDFVAVDILCQIKEDGRKFEDLTFYEQGRVKKYLDL